ncbi:MAG: 5-(carboxyamino)imidazole ribonucleotide mutase [Acidimicrobiia bacterium]|nr:5-(carboxyamino)imidazole ribonucleotide mutase [Acidimicrobiia bacterium]MYC57511.1 5-(carboxyamino)imidazole ribonucleotide mutase [Acidimicrobiia bacterium]MYG94951.1 5-(carboxyamino)imidazole ribonucleotide mutase [Acidimicrobiia bacterium]MYI29775.1 5-(carboxyamino)imidazole ribonucleotide mutase [Acidimicrobiia bacterium]
MSLKVAVIMGSASDTDTMSPARETLERFGVECHWEVMSAHRTPERVRCFVSQARDSGFGVIICGAGMAAHLAGVTAAHTTLPVIGVPLAGGAIGGVDALYATVQMPKGIPVATVAINGAMNAALLAIQILAVSNPGLADQLEAHRAELAGG